MKKTILPRSCTFLALTVFLFLAACSSASDVSLETPSDLTCSKIVDAKCVKCHYKTRICDALGTKSVRKWKQTIKFMVKQGALLNEDEQNKVVACLSSLPAGSDVVCR